MIGDAVTSGGLTDGVNANIVGISGSGTRPIAQILDPMLSDNGGPALTHMLVVGSLAIDAGTSLVGLGVTADQRGISRRRRTMEQHGHHDRFQRHTDSGQHSQWRRS